MTEIIHPETERLGFIDFFKCIGLFCVCLAHMPNLPEGIKLLRSFDVPFLMFVSASLGAITYRNSSYLNYVCKRFKRLVLPAWVYVGLLCVLFGAVGKLRIEPMARGFLLLQGNAYGHTWIVWVYFIVALLLPFIIKTKVTAPTLVLVFLPIIASEIVCRFTGLWTSLFLQHTIFYMVSYGFVAFFGVHAISMKKGHLLCFSIFFLVCFSCLMYLEWLRAGEFVSWLEYKFPVARLYFLTFGLFVSFLGYFLFRDTNFKFYKNPLLVFISRHSLWIFFWHSFVILAVYKFGVSNWGGYLCLS